jgi:hypothetical protein
MTDFLSGPESYNFPLWNGQDTSFIVKRKNSTTGDYINYDAGTTAKIVFVSGTTSYEFPAVVSGSEAQFSINDQDVVNVKSGSFWRLQFTINGKDKTPIVGKVVRKDA